MTSSLARLGGTPVRRTPFPGRATFGEPEKRAALEVLDSGCLSAFLGSPGELFLGGPQIRRFEAVWAERFGYRHAVTVNSWTTGLVSCVGALGIEPGDEVICPPYTMSASATSVLFYGGIPVFADIEPDTFCLDPASVEARITPRTKAIMVVHLFGGAADMTALTEVARRHGLRIIEDAAQAPGTTLDGRTVGALADIGGFSLNYHKHIHTGEGGVIVTDDDDLALRCRLIRNHGENAIEYFGVDDLTNVVGSNYRLTELQAAIGLAQLDRLPGILEHRRALVAHLDRRLAEIPGLTAAKVRDGSAHSYYVYPILFDARTVGIDRQRFIEAVNAELPPVRGSDDTPLAGGYVKPLYLNPVYQRRIALGRKGFPFNLAPEGSLDYRPGLCPVAERLYGESLLLSFLIREPLTTDDVDDFADALAKVAAHARDLA